MIAPVYHLYDEVGSTNDIAIEMARKGAPDGTVVLAQQQIAGRGRRGRVWQDDPGQSALMSIIIGREMQPEDYYGLSFMAGVAVAESLAAQCHLQTELKWPNDVMCGGMKLCGILVETCGSAAVIGVGVNVNQAAFPEEINDIATSVRLETGISFEPSMIAKSIAVEILSEYDRFSASGFEDILSHWRKYMWGIGRRVEITLEGRSIAGVISGVDVTGAIIVRLDSGDETRIHSADTIKTSVN